MVEKLQSGVFHIDAVGEESEESSKEKMAQQKRAKFLQNLLKNEQENKPNENPNRFDAQMITIASPIWGDIVLTKDYFLFVSFGLDIP